MAKTYIFSQLDDSEFFKIQTGLRPAIVPLEQSLTWGEFNSKLEGRLNLGSFRYDDENGKLVAIASAILYTDRGRDWIWIKHGPVFAFAPSTSVIKKMCATLREQFLNVENAKPVFIRLSMPSKTTPLVMPFEHTMYDETVVVDLSQIEDELFMGLSKSGRQDVRKAQKHAVEVKEITQDAADYFATRCYPILQETGAREGFGIHPQHVYTSMLENLKESRLYVALVSNKVEAWAITAEYGLSGLYYYAGSSARARDTSAAYALQWEIIKAMKARGITSYDLMGIAGQHFPALRNVSGFKLKFSKNVVSIPVTYDLPLRPLKYRTLSLAIQAKRKLRR